MIYYLKIWLSIANMPLPPKSPALLLKRFYTFAKINGIAGYCHAVQVSDTRMPGRALKPVNKKI